MRNPLSNMLQQRSPDCSKIYLFTGWQQPEAWWVIGVTLSSLPWRGCHSDPRRGISCPANHRDRRRDSSCKFVGMTPLRGRNTEPAGEESRVLPAQGTTTRSLVPRDDTCTVS